MNGTIDDRYFEWLYSKVGSVDNRNPHRSYWKLTRALYSSEFTWFVPNDDNRIADGKDLREEFESEVDLSDLYLREDFWSLGCSMFEMLIALSRRASFESFGTPYEWFWHLISNLELDRYTDDIYEISIEEEVLEAVEHINGRTYGKDGSGGLFPLRYAQHDQRKVELWYQMSAYLLQAEDYGLIL